MTQNPLGKEGKSLTEPHRAFLLTNDDGIDAPGIQALAAAVGQVADSFRVVAPLGPHSGCGHQVSTHRVVAMHSLADGGIAVDGTPADCVRVALHGLMPEVSWILSGINAGGNLGTDVHHSGTVAAVREGVIHGVPGIAFSHYRARGRDFHWENATRWTALVLRQLLARSWRPGTFWNVNLPHPEPGAPEPEIVFCQVDPSPLPLDFHEREGGLISAGDYQTRPRISGRDVDVCFSGKIAVSLVEVVCSVDPDRYLF